MSVYTCHRHVFLMSRGTTLVALKALLGKNMNSEDNKFAKLLYFSQTIKFL